MAGLIHKQDQENLTYAHQQAAASKPLNQLRPKTPGHKQGKVAFNNENIIQTQGKALLNKAGIENTNKGIGKTGAKGLSTPAAIKNRAPLGAKTTNAKARPFNTPLAQDDDKAKSGSAVRRHKLKIAESEPVKVNVLQPAEDDVPDIEYMPPKAIDIPDLPEELEIGVNLTMFENGGMQRDVFKHMRHGKGVDGKSAAERDAERMKIVNERSEAEDEALETYRRDSESVPCVHEPDCPTEECKDMPKRRQMAKTAYEQRLVEIRQSDKVFTYTALPTSTSKPEVSKVNITRGPTSESSRKAASALAMARPRLASGVSRLPPQTSRLPSTLFGRNVQPQTALKPSNPSPMRHTAAVATSNTTLGYGKGRAARANLRQGILGSKDTNMKVSCNSVSSTTKKPAQDLNSLQPAEYMRLHGEPKFLSEMWWKCKTAGLIKMPGEDDKVDDSADIKAAMFDGIDVEALEREEAEKDFELILS